MPGFHRIDFETANPSMDSACQLGLAVVQKGVIVERRVMRWYGKR